MIENTNTKQFYPGPILNDTLEISEFLFNTAEQIKIKHSKLDEDGVLRDVDLVYGQDYEVLKDEALTCDDGSEPPSHAHIMEMGLTASTGQITLKEHIHVVAGERLTAYRESAIIQDKNYPRTGAFPAATHEGALDYLTMQNQEQQDELDRALKVPISTQNFAGSMPLPIPGRALKINQDGSGFEMSEFDPDMAKIETDEARNQAKAAAEGAAKSEAEAIKQATDAKNAAKSAQEDAQEVLDKSDALLNMSRVLPMFTPIWSDHTLNDASFLRADTFSWHSGKIFTAGYDTLVAEYNNKDCVTETEVGVTYKRTPSGFKIANLDQHEKVLNAFTSTGKSWFYVLDTTQQRFKLPRTKYSFTGIRDTVGGGVDAGLPSLLSNSTGAHTHTRGTMNITGSLSPAWEANIGRPASGAFTASTSGGNSEVPNNPASGGATWNFDASKSWTGATSSNGDHSHTITDSAGVLGKSNTVQPPATQMYLYFFVGNYVRPSSDINVGKLVEYINEIDFVGETEDAKVEINTTKNNGINELNTTKNNCIKEINNTSVSGRVLKTGDTMTGSLAIKPSTNSAPLTLLSNNVDKTQAPEANTGIQLCMRDKNSQLVGLLEQWNYTTGEKRLTMRALNSISGTEKVCQIVAAVDANGNAFTAAPTPATGDNSTKIATTAYCVNMRCTTKATTTSSASTTRPCWVVQNYVSGTSWYRVWSDGWIEQGGRGSISSTTTISLIKAFTTTNYNIQVTLEGGTGNRYTAQIVNTNKTTSSFQIYCGHSETHNWYACGY